MKILDRIRQWFCTCDAQWAEDYRWLQLKCQDQQNEITDLHIRLEQAERKRK